MIMALVREGLSNREVARLGRSEGAVRHVKKAAAVAALHLTSRLRQHRARYRRLCGSYEGNLTV